MNFVLPTGKHQHNKKAIILRTDKMLNFNGRSLNFLLVWKDNI